MTCVIVDDDVYSLKLLQTYASKVPDLNLLGSFTNPIEATNFIVSNEPDVLFSDIHMPELNGIEFTKRFDNRPLVIFTTGFTEFAMNAFEIDAMDYLLKPITFEAFLKAVNKAKVFLKGSGDMFPNGEYSWIRSSGKFFHIYYKDILYIEGVKDYVMINMQLMKLPVAMNLSTIHKQLPRSTFIRVHKSFIVNFENIHQLSPDSLMVGDRTIPVGKTYSSELLSRMPADAIIKR